MTPTRPSNTSRLLRSSATKTWSVAVVAGVVGAIIASGVGVATGSFDRHTTVVQPVMRTITPTSMNIATPSTSDPSWAEVADRVAPSVVAITAGGAGGVQAGSGVLYVSGGGRSFILTSASLIGDGKLEVTFNNGAATSARVVGVDAESGLALVSVPETTFDVLPSFTMDENGIQVAEPILGVGAPASGPAIMSGSVNALDQAVDIGDDNTMENLVSINTSTPASTNPGSAVVDPQGAVFGIEAMVDTPDADAQGQSFVIPMDIAQHVAGQMLAGDRITHPWLGTVNTTNVPSTTAQSLRLAGGAQITQVTPGSPAGQAGLAPSDIITAFNGHPVRSTGGLTDLVAGCDPGHEATITYIHKGKPATTTVRLGETPSDVNLG